MVERLERFFPALRGTAYRVTSPADDRYNCISWAAGGTARRWWPDERDGPDSAYWPAGVPRLETPESFQEAFATLGYIACTDEQLEAGFEKVALFALAGAPKHMARQLPNGRWTSKLGPMEDIEHELHALTGLIYGSVLFVLKRPWPPR